MKKAGFQEGYPVQGFPLAFRWQTGAWLDLFEKHREFIVEDIRRARVDGRLVVYLSCPISGRGGGFGTTNVDAASHVARKLLERWGDRFWILNPSLYQMESKEGTGLIKRHAELIGLEQGAALNVEALQQESPPTGGDYLRMWTRVLVEDGSKNLGGRFDAYYFIGPTDIWDFFTRGGKTTLSEGLESYVARKLAVDSDFRAYFTGQPSQVSHERMAAFFRYYGLCASVSFSRGSHDEYNIWRELNRLRIKTQGPEAQIPGFFDGRQLEPNALEVAVSPGYATTP